VPFVPGSWTQVADVLLRMGRERPLPVVIDGFPYLARAAPSLPSVIQAAYAPRRAERTESRTRLLLCGSALSFMGGLLSGNAPLRGRASLDLTVQILNYQLAARFWGLADPRLAFLVNAVVGGTPAYRTEMIRYDTPGSVRDFDEWVVRAILSPGSPMFLEARYLLAEEPDLRDTALYHSVLAAIAEGNTTRGAIASHVGRKTNELAQPLPRERAAAYLPSRDDAAVLGAAHSGGRHHAGLAAESAPLREQRPRPTLREHLPRVGAVFRRMPRAAARWNWLGWMSYTCRHSTP